MILQFQILPNSTLQLVGHGANDISVMASIPMQTIYLRVGLSDPRGSLPTQYSVDLCLGCVGFSGLS